MKSTPWVLVVDDEPRVREVVVAYLERDGFRVTDVASVEAARAQLERALVLAPDLEPARVSLAQVRLAEGELEAAAALLEEILERSPRHGQALATLGQD